VCSPIKLTRPGALKIVGCAPNMLVNRRANSFDAIFDLRPVETLANQVEMLR
jgi:hypothetical protein